MKPAPKKVPSTEKQLIDSLEELNASVVSINYYAKLSVGMFQSFLKGIAYGLGALVAVAIVTPFIVWFLSSIAWPPLIAGFVTNVISQMEVPSQRQ